MKRLVILLTICILFFSCKERPIKYSPEAIALNEKASVLMNASKNDSALILLDKAISIDNRYYVAYGNKVVIYCQRKDYEKAKVEADNIIKAKPDLAEGWSFAGMLYEKQNDTIKAKEYYQTSVDLYDERIKKAKEEIAINTIRLNRAVSLILLGKEVEGRKELKLLKDKNLNGFHIEGLMNSTRDNIIINSLGCE